MSPKDSFNKDDLLKGLFGGVTSSPSREEEAKVDEPQSQQVDKLQ